MASWLTWLGGHISRALSGPSSALPGRDPVPRHGERIAIVPDRLWGTVTEHAIGHRACWTVVSDGLQAVGQREAAITLEHGESDGVWLREVCELYGTMLLLAEGGRVLQATDYLEFPATGRRRFLAPGVRGVMYLDPPPQLALPLPPRALVVQLLVGDELDMANLSGATRLAAALGHAASHYPWPYWCEPRRPSVFGPRDLQQTILAQVAPARTRGATATLHAGRVTLRVPRGAGPAWASACEQAGQVASGVPLEFDYHAEGWLIWRAGQRNPTAITAPGAVAERTGLSFLVLGAGVEHDELRLVEDGAALLLTDASATGLRQAFGHEQSWHLTAVGYSFALELV